MKFAFYCALHYFNLNLILPLSFQVCEMFDDIKNINKVSILDASELCDHAGGIEPLGMESGKIANEQITASSAHVFTYVGPHFGRLSLDQGGGGWCPARPIDVDNLHEEWIEVRLEHPTVIVAIATQGRYGQGRGIEYMSHYHVEYAREADEKNAQWILWKNNQSISVSYKLLVIRNTKESFLQYVLRISRETKTQITRKNTFSSLRLLVLPEYVCYPFQIILELCAFDSNFMGVLTRVIN